MTISAELETYYAEEFDEDARFTRLRGRLECERVRELLDPYLPRDVPTPPVADIGGGTGAHAQWFRDLGYDVALLDPIQRHVDIARDAGLSAYLGDARELPFGDDVFGLSLLAGPLYHLTARRDRLQALRAAVRVTAPGGHVAVVAHNRHANLIGATLANQLNDRAAVVGDIERFGHSPNNDRLPPSSYYHTVEELRGELHRAGLHAVKVRGVTGPGGWLAVANEVYNLDLDPTTVFANAINAAQYADRYPELTPASSILLAVGKVVHQGGPAWAS